MLGFTRQEQGIVLFLIATLALGSAVRLYQRFFAQGNEVRADATQIAAFQDRARALSAEDSLRSQEPVEFGELLASKEAVPMAGVDAKAEDDPASKFLINVNTADEQQLQNIPKIGPVLAQRIVSYRDEHGRFQSVADLLKVKGIGPATLEKIKPYVKIN